MTSAVPAGATGLGTVAELGRWPQVPAQHGNARIEVHPPFIEPLVARMSGRYDVPAADIRLLATEIHAQFADAPVRSFIEVLVEKQIRDHLRRRTS